MGKEEWEFLRGKGLCLGNGCRMGQVALPVSSKGKQGWVKFRRPSLPLFMQSPASRTSSDREAGHVHMLYHSGQVGCDGH